GTPLDETHTRAWEALGDTSAVACDSVDTRGGSYRGAWATRGALYDPDGTAQAAASGSVADSYHQRGYAVGLNRKRQHHSFANASNHRQGAPPGGAVASIGVTNGSTAVTGTGLTSGLCDGIGSGTATVTNGSYAITSSASFPSGMTSIL